MSAFPQTREQFDAYKAELEARGFTVLTRWRRGLKTIRLGDVVLSGPAAQDEKAAEQ
jgi:hypothetical protein